MNAGPVKNTRSVCPYCGVGCGVIVQSCGDRVVGVAGDPEHPSNHGLLCSKGRELHETVHLPSRLLYPEMRRDKNAPRKRTSWDSALNQLATALGEAKRLKGPDTIGFYVSGQLLTEDYYVFNKLAKGFVGTNNIDSNSRLCMSSAVAGYTRAFGADGPPACYDDLDHASLYFVVGANPAWCHPVLFRRMERQLDRPAGERPLMIVLDPRRTATAELADIHVPLRIGSDAVFITTLLAELVRRGRINGDYIRASTSGFDRLTEALGRFTPQRVEAECGISRRLFEKVVQTWSEAQAALTLWSMGVNQSAHGTDTVNSITNLHLATGQIGRPGAGPFSLTGQPNAMGGRETGTMANLLPAHRSLADPGHRKEVETFWDGGPLSPEPGLTAVEMFEKAADGGLEVLWIACTNPAVSLPGLATVRRALERTPLVVLQDVVSVTETARYADILLPAAGWGEKSGTMTNSERRLSAVQASVPPAGEARPDWQIVCGVAARMGFEGSFAFNSPSEILAEFARLTAGRDCDISGVTTERLGQEPLQWPCPSGAGDGSPRLYTAGRFQTADGRARFIVPGNLDLKEPVSDAYPLSLNTGRLRDQWHTMTKTGRVPELNLHAPEPMVEISPDDALRIGIRTGDRAMVESLRGSFVTRTEITHSVSPGEIFASMHWGEEFAPLASVNSSTCTAIDPVSKQPELKHAAVRLTKVACRAEGQVVIAGMGTAGLAVVERLRELQPDRPIVMVGDEPRLHYNRVRLHEVLSGRSGPDDLTVYPAEWYRERGIVTLVGVRAAKIDAGERRLYLEGGDGFLPYDQLVIATGAVPRTPGIPGNEKAGVFAVRRLDDVERLRKSLKPGLRVCVVGAGPLGLEIAGALKEAAAEVSVIGRSLQPLRGQIDEMAASLLTEILLEFGISCHFGVELEAVLGDEKVEALLLTNGQQLNTDIVVFASGVIAGNQLAMTAGLRINHRIVVNGRMETSIPGIYAVGEAAEFEGESVGLVPVARAQGEIAAAAIAGDPAVRYRQEPQVLSLKFPGLELRSVGRTIIDTANPEQEEIIYLDRRRHCYRKVVLDRDRIAGILVVGPFEGFMELDRKFRAGLRVGDQREQLLSPVSAKSAAQSGGGPVICSCCSVPARVIVEAATGGATTVAEIGKATGAGTRCGSCRPEIQAMLRQFSGREAAETSGVKTGLFCTEDWHTGSEQS